MENDYKYVEFKNDYVRKGRDIDYETDGFAFSITSIDGFSADPAEAGTVIANVFTTVHGDTFTNWHLSEYKDNPAAAACADEAAKKQKEEYAEYQKKPRLGRAFRKKLLRTGMEPASLTGRISLKNTITRVSSMRQFLLPYIETPSWTGRKPDYAIPLMF